MTRKGAMGIVVIVISMQVKTATTNVYRGSDKILQLHWKRNRWREGTLTADASKSNETGSLFRVDIFDQLVEFYENNYSSCPHGLWVNSSLGLRPHGLLTQCPFGLEEWLLISRMTESTQLFGIMENSPTEFSIESPTWTNTFEIE